MNPVFQLMKQLQSECSIKVVLSIEATEIVVSLVLNYENGNFVQ